MIKVFYIHIAIFLCYLNIVKDIPQRFVYGVRVRTGRSRVRSLPVGAFFRFPTRTGSTLGTKSKSLSPKLNKINLNINVSFTGSDVFGQKKQSVQVNYLQVWNGTRNDLRCCDNKIHGMKNLTISINDEFTNYACTCICALLIHFHSEVFGIVILCHLRLKMC